MTRGRVTVVGSANVDHVIRVHRLPQPGETVLGSAYAEHMGGKGANQAVAAARLGASVAFVGAVGTDAAGDRVLRALADEGVDCASVARIADAPTGAAVITVEEGGQNQIAVAPGANQRLDPPRVAEFVATLDPAVVLAVLEIPMAAVLAAAQAARQARARLVLNAAPATDLPDDLFASGPLIAVNAEERPLVGLSAETLIKRGAGGLLVTRGADGVSLVTESGETSIPGEHPGTVIDATGAGDAFVGALAVFLAEGMELEAAARKANASAALSVLREGARGGLPTRPELEAYLSRPPSD